METADTAQMLFIIERLAAMDLKNKIITGFNEVQEVQRNFYSESE